MSKKKLKRARQRISQLPTRSQLQQRTPTVDFYASFADAAYGALTSMEEANMKIQHLSLARTFKLDTQYSNKDMVVYVSATQVITAFRGTVPTQLSDLHADLKIALSGDRFASRFIQAKKLMQEVLDKYPSLTHIVTGHSLGGTLSLFVFQEFKDRIAAVYTFNPGAGKSVLISLSKVKCLFTGRASNVTNYMIRGDPISAIQLTDNCYKNVVLPARPDMNAHTLQQFLNE